jgi:hypothetical protein
MTMKNLLAILLIFLSANASAVDITITMTAGQIARFLAALGIAKNLKDGSNQPRAATNAEGKQWVIDQVRGLTYSIEGPAAIKSATDAVPAPTGLDPT